MTKFTEAWQQFESSLQSDTGTSAITLAIYMLIGGFLAMYVRWLYRRFSGSASDTDSITRIFPLLVIITAAVIAIVKSSLALSLGLVGALSIVRFRAAIKEPEELAYLFLCISIGLSLGAEMPFLAVALVSVATLFVLIMHWQGNIIGESRLLLTITGNSEQYFSGSEPLAISTLQEIAGDFKLQRIDIEDGIGQIRVALRRQASTESMKTISSLRHRMPDCDFSYVNLDETA